MNKINNSLKIQRLLNESKKDCQSGNFLKAKNIYQDLIKMLPNHPEVLGNLGTIELKEGNIETGIDYLKKSIEKDPSNSIFLTNIANGLLDNNRPDEALLYYNAALKINPTSSNLFFNIARAYKALNKFNEAITNYKEAIHLNDKNITAYLNLGFLFNEINEYELAIRKYSDAINIDSTNFQLYYNRGIALENLKKYDLALEDYNKAIQLNRNFDLALFNKSGVLAKLNQFDNALKTIDEAIALNKNNLDFFIKKAFIFEEQKEFNNAMNLYDYILTIDPNHKETKVKKSYIQLALNDFSEGWKLYENRFWNKQKLETERPELEYFNVSDKKIFIWAEQGLGDQIIYSSLLKDAFKTQNMFYISLDHRLLNLFTRSFSWAKNVNFISSTNQLSEALYDFHLPIGSLGKFFRGSVEDFKGQPIAYLKANNIQANTLREQLKKEGHQICGISWKSKNKEIGEEKSLSLIKLLPILSKPNITFVNLQYGDTSEEIQHIFNTYGIKIKTIDEIDNFNDLDGLTSIIEACDFIVTTSNITAHLAGALNKKTYLLLPFAFGKIWYWGEALSRSLWYPSIDIYRKTNASQWDMIIDQLSKKLEELYA